MFGKKNKKSEDNSDRQELPEDYEPVEPPQKSQEEAEESETISKEDSASSEKWEVREVPTQSQKVIYDKESENALDLHQALVKILNKLE